MKKIIPFNKKMTFKTNVNEIASIALENSLHSSTQSVEGDIIINGTYKITETSTQVDEFEFKIPINIEIDKKYKTDNMIIDINDFYYELINNNILEVNIEILLDNIIEEETITQEEQETPIKQEKIIEKEERKMEEQIKNINEVPEKKQDRCIEEEEPVKINKEEPYMKTIFENFKEDTEEYSTYHIYIVREGDTLDKIMTTYNITREKLTEYNNIDELKLGDKIIIPEENAKN